MSQTGKSGYGMNASFTFHLRQRILPRRVTVAKFDGVHPCITAATVGDKVFVHNPHGTANARKKGERWYNDPKAPTDVTMLNIQQTITCLSSGALKTDTNEEVLLIGTPTNLLAYDVENNCDLFYKEVQDGANCMVAGVLGSLATPLVLVGGNCSIVGFDAQGNDTFWTVTGDNVSAMALCDYNGNGQNELIVGSEDYDIRVFREDVITQEMTETDAIVALCPLHKGTFAYALANGTVGVYGPNGERMWRIKSKNQAICLIGYDVDGDGILELITGWSNGKVDARNSQTGEVVYKDTFTHPIAGIVRADYSQEGREQLIVCAADGEVRGYLPTSVELRQQIQDAAFEQDTVRNLSTKKQALLLELENYEKSAKLSNAGATPNLGENQFGFIPASTELRTGLAINMGNDSLPPHVEVILQTNNETIIKMAIVFAEGLFDGESLILHPSNEETTSAMSIPFTPAKDTPVDLHIKALVSHENATYFHVFEVSRSLPKFAMYAPCRTHPDADALGHVTIKLNEPASAFCEWINKHFLMQDDVEAVDNEFKATFLSLRETELITLHLIDDGTLTIYTNAVNVAGEMIQSVADFFQLSDLSAEANFPKENEHLETLMAKVEEHQASKLQISAAMADNSALIRALVIRAEDARLIHDYQGMKKWYHELQLLNRELLNNYKIRCNSHEELMEYLRQLNQCIQRAANLRVGRFKSQLVNACRAALKANNLPKIIKIISTGEE